MKKSCKHCLTSGGSALLNFAAKAGYLNIVHLLIRTNGGWAYSTLKSKSLQQHLISLAAEKGHEEIAQYLRRYFPRRFVEGDGFTPVHIASVFGHLGVVQRLQGSSTIHSRTKWDRHALHYAARFGHLAIVKFLVDELHVDPDLPYKSLTGSGEEPSASIMTPAFLASTGHYEVVEYLCTKSVDLGIANHRNYTMLHQAARGDSVDLTKLLLKSGLDALAKTAGGYTAFHLAAYLGNVELIKAYLNGAFTSWITTPFEIDHTSGHGSTALLIAARNGHFHVAHVLLEHGSDPSHADEDGKTPLLRAAMKGHQAIVSELLLHGANVNAADTLGHTPLMAAAHDNHLAAVERLLEHGASVNMVDSRGCTALIGAAKGKHKDCFATILAKGGDPISIRDDRGRNALDFVHGHSEFQGLVKSANGSAAVCSGSAGGPPNVPTR